MAAMVPEKVVHSDEHLQLAVVLAEFRRHASSIAELQLLHVMELLDALAVLDSVLWVDEHLRQAVVAVLFGRLLHSNCSVEIQFDDCQASQDLRHSLDVDKSFLEERKKYKCTCTNNFTSLINTLVIPYAISRVSFPYHFCQNAS